MVKFAIEAADPTQHDLGLALLDQNVAGQFGEREYAYTAVYHDGGHGLGIAVLDEPGYWPVPLAAFKADNHDAAADIADGMNAHIGLTEVDAIKIVASSFRAKKRRFKVVEED